MTSIDRRQLIGAAVGAGAALFAPAAVQAQVFTFPTPSYYRPSAVIAWMRALNAAIAATFTEAPVSARAASMLSEAMYNAWAAYDPSALFTVGGMSKRPFWEWTDEAKRVAVSNAAWRVLVDLFPTQRASFDAVFAGYGYASGWTNLFTLGFNPAPGVGANAAQRVLAYRANDKSNQRGQLGNGPYKDWTGYQPVNRYNAVVDPTRWQPLFVTTATGVTGEQSFLTPHWGKVTPFALPSGSALRPTFGQPQPTWGEMQELITLSAQLNDRTKAQVDFWAANPGSVSPPGQWLQITEVVARQDRNGLDQDVKLFFAVSQALLDASIAVWDAKRFYDSVRPITAIRHYLAGQTILSWVANQGTQPILGQNWAPYQRAIRPTPPFPEFPSGHSAFSFASATVLAGLRGAGATIVGTVPAGGIAFEANTPAQDVVFQWNSVYEAAESAAYSRRLGGIHFERGDLASRTLGQQVGNLVLAKVRTLYRGW